MRNQPGSRSRDYCDKSPGSWRERCSLLIVIRPYDGFSDPGQPDATIYDYAALETLEEFKELTEHARVILAYDTETKSCNVAYGTELLRAIAHKVLPPQVAVVVRFAVSYQTTYIKQLIAAVRHVKGFDEWSGGSLQ